MSQARIPEPPPFRPYANFQPLQPETGPLTIRHRVDFRHSWSPDNVFVCALAAGAALLIVEGIAAIGWYLAMRAMLPH